jgi:hypothetical protein
LTKNLLQNPVLGLLFLFALSLGALPSAVAQQAQPAPTASAVPAAAPAVPSPALALYRQLRGVGLDGQKIFHVRDGDLDREDIHLSLTEGTIAFTQEVDGHVTGALFEGDGEILVVPPNQTERASLALFTHAAVLEEKFTTAYLRFNDNTYDELSGALRPMAAEEKQEFFARWNPLAESMADADALRLLLAAANHASTHIFHVRLAGVKLGSFDISLDTSFEDQIYVAQTSDAENGARYYDLWTAFPMRSVRKSAESGEARETLGFFDIPHYKINTHILSSHDLETEAQLKVRATHDGLRAMPFELSRFLQLKSVEMNGTPAEFIQNEAIPGSQLARRGNDLFVVLLPRSLHAGEEAELKFVYSGSVLSEAGGGLMYLGARGIWYPNQGPDMATFDLDFRYPSDWTLVASGHRTSLGTAGAEQVAHWISDRPVPLAGFNLGQYVSSSAHVGDTLVETYAARGVEERLRHALTVQQDIERVDPRTKKVVVESLTSVPVLNPSEQVKPLTQRAADTINFISARLGPYPFPSLALTQVPGSSSQGWPGLIYLSSYAFLDPSVWDVAQMRASDFDRIMYDKLMPAHEIAHQWWGDGTLWATYRDEWMMEGLSNYFALLELESTNPEKFRIAMDHYRRVLLEKNKEGLEYKDAGAVTLGTRLASSKFPEGYDKVLYGRGTWLVHMLRMMLHDPERAKAGSSPVAGDELFFQVMRAIQQQHGASRVSTQELEQAFEKVIPESLSYENKKSLDWFFSNWVNGTAIPKIEADQVRITRKTNGDAVVTGKLIQSEIPEDFVTSVPVYGGFAAPNQQPVLLGRVFADGKETDFRLPAPAGVTHVLVDPYQTILRRP